MKNGGQQKWAHTYLFIPTALLSVFFVLMAVVSLWAQTATTGSISGGVTDPSAAVIAGVPVTLKNLDTGSSTSTTTYERGTFNLSLRQPKQYSVTSNAAGLQA